MADVPQDICEKAMRRYRYQDDAEAQACVAAASKAWREAFALSVPRYYHIPGTDTMLRIGPIRKQS